jgi:hypothetical protein
LRSIVTGAILSFVLLNFHVGYAGAGDPVLVTRVTPQLVNNQLVVSGNFENLFSAKIVGTIQSGLPSIIQIEIKLNESSGKQIADRKFVRSISYDVWENRYTVSGDTVTFFRDFDEVKKISSRIEKLAVASVQQLRRDIQLTIQMRVAIIPISSSQGKKVSDWLLDPNQTEETLASDDRAGGFKLNLTNLISFFVGDKKQSQYSSQWQSSPSFRLVDLK